MNKEITQKGAKQVEHDHTLWAFTNDTFVHAKKLKGDQNNLDRLSGEKLEVNNGNTIVRKNLINLVKLFCTNIFNMIKCIAETIKVDTKLNDKIREEKLKIKYLELNRKLNVENIHDRIVTNRTIVVTLIT